MNDPLLTILSERLDSDPAMGSDSVALVLAACEGADELEAVLIGGRARERKPGSEAPRPEEPGAYLRSVTVEGFRGIGPPATLELTPGPGLTLVVGRNGSGKSSFAEGLEVLLTGDSRRWSHRSQIWREGWRNLHHPTPTSIGAQFGVEGRGRPLDVYRRWPPDAELPESEVWAQFQGETKANLASLGWQEPLVAYRPFLSYNELGSMLDAEPSKLYDALSSILGLDDLVRAEAALRGARLTRERAAKVARAELKPLLEGLRGLDDERAARCIGALGGGRWDLDTVESVLLGSPTEGSEGEIELLRGLSTLEAPSLEQVLERTEELRAGARGLADVVGTEDERATHASPTCSRRRCASTLPMETRIALCVGEEG